MAIWVCMLAERCLSASQAPLKDWRPEQTSTASEAMPIATHSHQQRRAVAGKGVLQPGEEPRIGQDHGRHADRRPEPPLAREGPVLDLTVARRRGRRIGIGRRVVVRGRRPSLRGAAGRPGAVSGSRADCVGHRRPVASVSVQRLDRRARHPRLNAEAETHLSAR